MCVQRIPVSWYACKRWLVVVGRVAGCRTVPLSAVLYVHLPSHLLCIAPSINISQGVALNVNIADGRLINSSRVIMAKKGGSSPSLHKVIMVGSGGVGKSALTLQVSHCVLYSTSHQVTNVIISLCMMSLWKITSQPKLTHTEKKLFSMEKR